MKRIFLISLFFIFLFNVAEASSKERYPEAKPVTLVVGFTYDCDYICDGADDYVQVQQAVDQLLTGGVGGTVLCRAGVYDMDIGSGVNIETKISSTTITGEGDGTIFRLNGSRPLFSIAQTNCRMMNFQIHAVLGADLDIGSFTGDDCMLYNCFINNEVALQGEAIRIFGDRNIVSRNRMNSDSNAYAMLVVFGDDCIVSGNVIRANLVGIKLQTGDNNLIENNRITAPTGVLVISGGDENQIQGNNFEGCTATQEITDGGVNTKIRNNVDSTGASWLPEVLTSLIADATKQNKVEIDDNKAVIEELSSSTLELYYTDEFTSSGEYRLMTSTIPSGAESTIVSSMDSATVVVTTFTVETVLGLSALRKGLYHSHFHAEMNNTNRDVRLRFEVWNGTGTGETFLFSSEQSNLMTADKTSYDVHVSTDEIITTINYLAVRIVADVTGAAAAPDLTFYMEGDNSSLFEMPALLSDVGVTKIVAGLNINIGSSNGRGEVPINVDTNPKLESVEASGEGSFNTVVSTDNIYANKDVVHGRIDANTKLDFGVDQAGLVAGGKDVIRGIETIIDIIYVGDGTWAYIVFGDTTNFINEISSYTYATKLWSLRNLEVFYGIKVATLTVTQITSGDAGSTDYVYTRFPSSDSWARAAAGGGGGNKNDEENLEAEQFSTAGNTNNAAIYLLQQAVTYDGVISTAARYSIKLPDSARPNHAFASMNWSKQWDDGTVNIYVTFVTSGTSDGNANLRVGISTCAFVGGSFEIYDSTTDVGSGWCDQKTATMTISSTSILFDGKHIMVHVGRGSEDTSTETVYVLNTKFVFAKD